MHGESGSAPGPGRRVYFPENLRNRDLPALRKCVGRIAIGAAQVASGQANEITGQPGKRALPLQTAEHLINTDHLFFSLPKGINRAPGLRKPLPIVENIPQREKPNS